MTELTDRMRTCAAHIEAHADLDSPYGRSIGDAVGLLREAAFELDRYAEVENQVFAPIEQTGVPAPIEPPIAHWIGDDLQPIPNQPIGKNACPNCDSRTTKIVRAAGRKIELECPVCSFRWQR